MVDYPAVRQGMAWRDMSAADLNYLAQQVRKSLNLSVGPGLHLRHTGDAMHLNLATRFAPQSAGAEAPGTFFAYFKVASPADWYQHRDGDAILAHPWDGTTEGEDAITIAKPHKIRRTPFDQTGLHNGIKYEYALPTLMSRKSIKGEGEAEVRLTFVVTPSYYAGEIIEARRGPTLLDDVVWQDTTVRTWGLHPQEELP